MKSLRDELGDTAKYVFTRMTVKTADGAGKPSADTAKALIARALAGIFLLREKGDAGRDGGHPFQGWPEPIPLEDEEKLAASAAEIAVGDRTLVLGATEQGHLLIYEEGRRDDGIQICIESKPVLAVFALRELVDCVSQIQQGQRPTPLAHELIRVNHTGEDESGWRQMVVKVEAAPSIDQT